METGVKNDLKLAKVARKVSASPFVIRKRQANVGLQLNRVEKLLTDDAIKAEVFAVSFWLQHDCLYFCAFKWQFISEEGNQNPKTKYGKIMLEVFIKIRVFSRLGQMKLAQL